MKLTASLAAVLRHGLWGNLLLALVYLISAQLVRTLLAAQGQIALIWPPSGIALAVLLLAGNRYWPGILAGALATSLWLAGSQALTGLLIACGALLEALYCAWWLRRQTDFSVKFEQLNDFRHLIMAALVGTLISAGFGNLALLIEPHPAHDRLGLSLLQWWQGNLLGVLLFTPLILVWRQSPWRDWFRSGRMRILEWGTFMLLTFLVGQIVYVGWWSEIFAPIAQSYWSLLFLIWAAVRFGRHGVLLMLAINGAQGLLGVSQGSGYFADDLARTGLMNLSFSYLLATLTGIALSLVTHERNQVERSLSDQAELADGIIQSLPGMFYMLDESNRLLRANRRLLEETGHEAHQLIDASIDRLLAPEAREQTMNSLQQARSRGEIQGETLLLRHDGKSLPYFFYARHCLLAGQPRLLGLAYDISERKQMEEALRSSEQLFQSAINGAGDVVWDWDVATHRISHSARWNQLLGYAEDVPANEIGNWDERIHPDDLEAARKNNAALFDGKTETTMMEIRLRDRDGQWKWILSRGMVMQRDERGLPLRIAGTLTDISQIKEQQQQLERIAHFDSLTGVPNRFLLNTRLRQTLGAARPHGSLIAISYLDLDGFKEINDTHGHDVGDSMLVAITQRLRRVLRECDTLARIGGDEFVILMAELENETACHVLLERLLSAVAAPVRLNDLKLQVSASIGVTLHPTDASDADQLLRHADQAMYRAKQTGKNRYCIYGAGEIN
ncbi:putative Diguanylate cyclase [Sterolibacterium denitrificans]|uniref:Diguanylate cyclase n=1 Tax=Sterolibacterium denitrificans TaxID=157592 RepID=A0A7Z7HTV1_9PROT|nr:sensor domain-containing diguanylate cyclase [Sterolibacterium denitrificans]SMB28268.1 putative Diguanylate cyclase [Sterolibacterium denitrificans]